MLRRRTVPQGLPLHSNGQASSPEYDWKKKQRSSSKLSLPLGMMLLVAGAISLMYFHKRNDNRRLLYGSDSNVHCTDWAGRGECLSNRVFMLSNCPEACFDVGVSIDSLSDQNVLDDATRGFAHFVHDGDEEQECRDHRDDCEELAQEGKCMESNDVFDQCMETCLACFGSQRTTVTIDFGVEQETYHENPNVRNEVQNVISKTRDYMINQVFKLEEFESVRRDCRNLDPHCSIYAAMGECHGTNDALQMFQNCAPACHACNAVEYYRRCARRPEQEDVFSPGDMNAIFTRISNDTPRTSILSQPTTEELSDDELPLPWVLVLDDFASDEECDWFIAKGHEIGFKVTSEISDEIEEDGTFGNKIGQGRTSTDAWCTEACEDQPVAKRVLDRMLNLTGIPKNNTEYMEILKYETGGHYERHHDVIGTQGTERCGNRMLTFYLFLSDVEEGGELRFTEIEKDVQPKKGRAVLWQNVLDDDFDVMQTWTFHEAMPVRAGKKYGMNLWLHPRDMREALELDCC